MENRVIVGFDLRPSVSPSDSLLVSSAASFARRKHLETPCTLDLDVWPRSKDAPAKVATNNFDLYWLPDFWGCAYSKNEAVAFDLGREFLALAGHSNHVTQLSVCALQVNEAWEMIGYDISDQMISYSGLWSFDWDADKFPGIIFDRLPINRYGLIDDIDRANSVASALTKLYDEYDSPHSPFGSCGVWRRRAA
jgi:hypothetical protein